MLVIESFETQGFIDGEGEIVEGEGDVAGFVDVTGDTSDTEGLIDGLTTGETDGEEESLAHGGLLLVPTQ